MHLSHRNARIPSRNVHHRQRVSGKKPWRSHGYRNHRSCNGHLHQRGAADKWAGGSSHQVTQSGHGRHRGHSRDALDVFLAQPPASPEEERLDRGLTDIQLLRDGCIAQAFNFTQHEYPLVARGEPLEGLGDGLMLLTGLDTVMWSILMYGQRGNLLVGQRTRAFAATEGID